MVLPFENTPVADFNSCWNFVHAVLFRFTLDDQRGLVLCAHGVTRIPTALTSPSFVSSHPPHPLFCPFWGAARQLIGYQGGSQLAMECAKLEGIGRPAF